MSLPKFVFIQSKELASGELILHTEQPFPLVRVYKFEGDKSLEDFEKKYNVFGVAQRVPGYNILLCFVGTIEAYFERPLLGHNITADVLNTLKKALNFYETERIKGNESRNKKFARS